MQFKNDAAVLNANGEQVGSVNRVVIDPRTGEITHVVVNIGNFLLPDDRVVPIDNIAWTGEDEISLEKNLDDLSSMPRFEEQHYVAVSEDEAKRLNYPVTYSPPYFWYPHYGAPGMAYLGYPGTPLAVETERNTPEGTVALKEGAKVISADGEQVGDIERVLAAQDSDQVTHFLVSRGLLSKQKKLVPVEWVRSFEENEVRLAVGQGQVDQLPDYQE